MSTLSAAATPLPPATLPADPARNPFEIARSHLIRQLLELRVPAAHAIGEASDHIRDAANIFDEWLFAIGQQVGDRVNTDVDIRPFQGAFLDAVEGNATYEVECACEDARRFRVLRRAM